MMDMISVSFLVLLYKHYLVHCSLLTALGSLFSDSLQTIGLSFCGHLTLPLLVRRMVSMHSATYLCAAMIDN